ncbi:MAG: lipocalin family protein [Gammaproteobacteria bacterium]
MRPLDNLKVQRKEQGPLRLPLVWSLALPAIGPDYEWVVRALEPDHWLDLSFPYWVGPVVAEGENPGLGYLELTGY